MEGNINFIGSLSGDISGGGGGGSDVTITPTLETGTKIADYEVNGVAGILYAPTPTSLTAELPLSIYNNIISIDLSDYATQSDISDFVTDTELVSVLDNYVTSEALITILDNYVTDSELSNYQPKLTAGSNITIDPVTNIISASGGSTWDYSTNEVNTGQKWINGATIYCRVIHYATPLQIPNGWVKAITVTDESWLPIGLSYAVDDTTQGTTPLVTDFDDNDGLFVSNLRNVTFNASEVVCFYIKNS